jgi:hypothetical protein
MRDDFGWGYTGFTHVFGFILYGIFALLSVAVAVAVIFFLIRFLIVGTKAAQLYIAKNTPAKPAAPVTEPATRGPVEPSSPVGPTTTPTGSATSSATSTVAAPVDEPVAPPATAAPKAAPKATPPITPPATKKPPVKKTPQPPVV